jgi:hypothetical protein
MLRKSIKYFIVLSINALVLWLLMLIWTDRVELILCYDIRNWEGLKILAFSFLCIIGVGGVLTYCKNKNITEPYQKMKITAIVCVGICSYLYATYLYKTANNRLFYWGLRSEIAKKMDDKGVLGGYSSSAKNLNFREYQEIKTTANLPDISEQASHISYNRREDLFLPDYYFTLSYDLPKSIKRDTFHEGVEGDYSESQTVTFFEGKQRVEYNISEQ